MMKYRTVHWLHRLYENDKYNAKMHGRGVSNSLNGLFVCNPFNYIPNKNANH